ncbi:unnamed protein product, partial [Ascophyllum nodosum]
NGGGGRNGGGGGNGRGCDSGGVGGNRGDGGSKNRSGGGETGFLEIKARRRADMKEPQTPLTTVRSTVAARATTTRAQVGATTTRGEPSASATSPPAKSSCVRPSYDTPQPTPERQFPVTRRQRGAGRYMGI